MTASAQSPDPQAEAVRSAESAPEGGHFLSLLIALVVLFLLYPVMVELGLIRLYRLGFIAFLIVAVWTLSHDRRVLVISIALGLTTVAGQFGIFVAPTPAVVLVTGTLAMLFLAFTTVVTLAAVLRPGKVTTDKLAGAICAYLLLGLTFSVLFSLVEFVKPGSFSFPAGFEARRPAPATSSSSSTSASSS